MPKKESSTLSSSFTINDNDNSNKNVLMSKTKYKQKELENVNSNGSCNVTSNDGVANKNKVTSMKNRQHRRTNSLSLNSDLSLNAHQQNFIDLRRRLFKWSHAFVDEANSDTEVAIYASSHFDRYFAKKIF